MATDNITKTCKECLSVKPLSDFYKRFDYIHRKCKECTKAKQRITGKLYRQTIRGKETMRKAQRKYVQSGKATIKMRLYRRAHPDYAKRDYRNGMLREDYRERRRLSWRKAAKQQRIINRTRVLARDKFRKQIKLGKIPRPNTLSCKYCGNQANHYHHHNGYDKAHIFDVIPLCRSCHVKIHWEPPTAPGE